MKVLYVLTQSDTDWKESDVICVADSKEKIEELIAEYFGEYPKVDYYDDIRESGLEWTKHVTDSDGDKSILVLQYFILNEL